MSKKPTYWNSAIKYLSKKDKVMKKIINQYKDKTLTTRKDIFIHYAKVLLDNKSVLLLQILYLKNLTKLVKGK